MLFTPSNELPVSSGEELQINLNQALRQLPEKAYRAAWQIWSRRHWKKNNNLNLFDYFNSSFHRLILGCSLGFIFSPHCCAAEEARTNCQSAWTKARLVNRMNPLSQEYTLWIPLVFHMAV